MEKLLKNKYFAYFGAVLCTALWGTAFPLIKLSYSCFRITDVFSKVTLAGIRFALAGIMVLMVGTVICKKTLATKISDIKPILCLSAFQTIGQYLFSYIGVGLTTAGNTSIISGSASLFSVMIACVILKEKLTTPKVLGCVVGFMGIACINWGGISVETATLLGDLLVLASAFSGAVGNVVSKVVVQHRNVISVTGWQLLFGGVVLLLVGIISGGKVTYNFYGVVILLWLSVVSGVGFALWTALLRYHPVSRITIFNMLVPVFGTIWSGIILGEDIFRTQNIISLVLISVGIVLVNLRGKIYENQSSSV